MQRLKLLGYGLTMTTALLLTACGGGGSDPLPPGPQPEAEPFSASDASVIHGQLQPWGSQWASSVGPVNAAIEKPGADFKAPVLAGGQFDLHLPSAEAMNTTYAGDLMTVRAAFGGCTNVNVTGAPEGLKIAQINELQTDTGKSIVATSNGGTTFKTYWYANKDANITINASECVGFTSTLSTLNLKAGWNVVDQQLTTPAKDVVLNTYTIGAVPTTRTVWTERGQALGQLGLSPDFLRPWVKANSAK